MTVHGNGSAVVQSSSSLSSGQIKQEHCGCKGIRYCKLCADSERVTNLSNMENAKKYSDYQYYIYNGENCVKSTDLASTSTLQDVQLAYSSVLNESYDKKDLLIIDGLTLIPNFLSEEEEQRLITRIDADKWNVSQSGRRKQDFGPRVNFKQKKIKLDSFYGMPDYTDFLLHRMLQNPALIDYQPFELCNLEYSENRASSIDFHQDDSWIWGNRLISVNLVSPSVMTLQNEQTKVLIFIYMPRRSLLCMANEARYKYNHGIFAQHITGRRIGLTMREPSEHFQEGGELFEKYGKELIMLGNKYQ
uniref:Alpha-ketoglutarate-dependent dioxygenase AlkB-like domain-containing protein n=1 Tax=Ditylenchus dipsaci TaxID=166011 RepID=A0A915E9F6_9BILA